MVADWMTTVGAVLAVSAAGSRQAANMRERRACFMVGRMVEELGIRRRQRKMKRER
jgi:hypothetical protein